jgi:hypothetical protein
MHLEPIARKRGFETLPAEVEAGQDKGRLRLVPFKAPVIRKGVDKGQHEVAPGPP